jgi:hypothetical protein
MIEIKNICDKCKKEEITYNKYSNPDGWRTLTLSYGSYGNKHDYVLCKECFKSFEPEAPNKIESKSVADRFMDLIYEIVEEAKNNQ